MDQNFEHIRAFKKDHGYASVKNLANKIFRLIIHTTKEFSNTSIYFSTILPKFGRSFNSLINYVNNEFLNLCLDNQKIGFIRHSNFAVNHHDFFWRDKIQTSNIGLRQHRFATTSHRLYFTRKAKKTNILSS